MIEYFKELRPRIIDHALEEFPKEAVGIIQNDDYIPLKNLSARPEETFEINPAVYLAYAHKAEIQALVHSHNDFPHASKADAELQMKLNIPFGIVNINNSEPDWMFWGDSLPIQDLIGRPFHFNVYDCFRLVRDYYRMLGIIIPNKAREFNFWNTTKGSLLEDIKDFKCYEIELKDVREHDVLLYSISGNMIDHIAVVSKNQQVIHHFVGKLSKRYSLANQMNKIKIAYRYDGVIND